MASCPRCGLPLCRECCESETPFYKHSQECQIFSKIREERPEVIAGLVTNIILFWDLWLCVWAGRHIFPKVVVASNKNAHNIWHHFLAHFYMPINHWPRSEGNTFLFCFSQQLPHLHLGSLKGFLNSHSTLQEPSTCLVSCFLNYRKKNIVFVKNN